MQACVGGHAHARPPLHLAHTNTRQAFLQRNEADIRKREINQQLGWAHSMHIASASAGQVTCAALLSCTWVGEWVHAFWFFDAGCHTYHGRTGMYVFQ